MVVTASSPAAFAAAWKFGAVFNCRRERLGALLGERHRAILNDIVAHAAAHFVQLRHVRVLFARDVEEDACPSVPEPAALTVLSARSNAAIDTGDCGPRPSIMPPRAKNPDSSTFRPRDAAALSSAGGVLASAASASAVLRRLRFGLLAHQRRSRFPCRRRDRSLARTMAGLRSVTLMM